jgi:hypothetical protein
MQAASRLSRALALLVIVLVAAAAPARAAVGDDASAVTADQARLRATLRIVAMKAYAMHELTTPAGATMREYVASGKIFAVSWSGGWRPDLREVMGTRYQQYLEARRGRPRARGPVHVELPGMVVVMGGYLRTSWGHVTLTDLAPPGWNDEALRGAP